jgi:serine/threonine protein phosphatase PrpC
MLELDFAHCSDIGPTRERNEDFCGHTAPEDPRQARARGWLFALADGVGGQNKGEVASQLAVETMLREFAHAESGEAHAALLPRLVQAANAAVYEAAADHSDCAGMATTLVACGLRFNQAAIAHVGDSRCYLLRQGGIRQLTRDHSLVNEHLRLGLIASAEDASVSRHILCRAVGYELFVAAEITTVEVVPGDLLLLCCDGLHGALPEDEIARIALEDGDLERAAQRLVDAANERDGSDNVSVQLIRVRAVERVGMYRGQPYRLR